MLVVVCVRNVTQQNKDCLSVYVLQTNWKGHANSLLGIFLLWRNKLLVHETGLAWDCMGKPWGFRHPNFATSSANGWSTFCRGNGARRKTGDWPEGSHVVQNIAHLALALRWLLSQAVQDPKANVDSGFPSEESPLAYKRPTSCFNTRGPLAWILLATLYIIMEIIYSGQGLNDVVNS